ncbi:hypothetical protein [Olivibacter sitiensis]|uniref:hypothetical protein n=1 Tax=Olivibacter sitiensis TaxID=376470 RepID=UPI00040C9EED|nr:hypothetical protein [Olivibacter sitiensis]
MKQKAHNIIYLIFLFLFFPTICFSQKMIYVYCPSDIEIPANDGKLSGSKINLVINDIRNLPENSKVECDSEEIKRILAESIINSFPSSIINYVNEAPELREGHYTVTVNITAYHSASGTAATEAIGSSGDDFSWGALPANRWNSVAGYHVIIESTDGNTVKKQSRNIANVVSRPNIGGSLTSKKALSEAYTEARRELLFFIESTLTSK